MYFEIPVLPHKDSDAGIGVYLNKSSFILDYSRELGLYAGRWLLWFRFKRWSIKVGWCNFFATGCGG